MSSFQIQMAKPPLIGDSQNFNSLSVLGINIGENIILGSKKVEVIDPPIENTDAVNKAYVDSVASAPSLPDLSVQYNNNGSFGGDADFYYDDVLKILHVNNISLTSGTISSVPVGPTDITNKAYVDSLGSTPAGSNGNFQYNNNGAFGGISTINYDLGLNEINVTGTMNVPDPTTNLQVANKQYVDNATGSSPGNPDQSIQYNNNGSFSGSNNLLWNNNINTLTVTGTIIADKIVSTSSILLKNNVQKISNSIELLDKINSYEYDFKNERNYGLIAEELEENDMKQLVSKHNNYKRVDYIQVIPILVDVVKKLIPKIKKRRSNDVFS